MVYTGQWAVPESRYFDDVTMPRDVKIKNAVCSKVKCDDVIGKSAFNDVTLTEDEGVSSSHDVSDVTAAVQSDSRRGRDVGLDNSSFKSSADLLAEEVEKITVKIRRRERRFRPVPATTAHAPPSDDVTSGAVPEVTGTVPEVAVPEPKRMLAGQGDVVGAVQDVSSSTDFTSFCGCGPGTTCGLQ